MKQEEFNAVERRATEKGGEEAGAFLETIGKTDMAKLTFDEWGEFCRRMIGGYRNSCKSQALDADIPF